ncbi:hypothetical protein BGW36DRAFT_371475 [Talaromyces proteolyticus]|uniref:Uncharacterized protein n=1 Tax=Talaromyces proteolyticus TaxID=1131652 RepID=A0AAD4Q101_9EURO|nr:uncharacterized protein BGW36DRAFT_371475 [Talaromyces proteolyticus]KAH8701749.1 hypothetical protein BGW36DRAFT_371475 [Talaromyces proteolyticus]
MCDACAPIVVQYYFGFTLSIMKLFLICPSFARVVGFISMLAQNLPRRKTDKASFWLGPCQHLPFLKQLAINILYSRHVAGTNRNSEVTPTLLRCQCVWKEIGVRKRHEDVCCKV